LRIRQRAEDFLMGLMKQGPRTTRDIWEAAKQQHLSQRTLDRARHRLDIRSVRVGAFTPQQTTYWLLPHQDLPPEVAQDETAFDLHALLRDQMNQLGERTPLDELDER